MLPEELLNLLEQARQTTDPARARTLLSKALKADPKSEEAWLLFSEVAEKNEHAIYCLEQVLKINPANLQAAQKLDALKAPPEPILASPAVPDDLSQLQHLRLMPTLNPSSHPNRLQSLNPPRRQTQPPTGSCPAHRKAPLGDRYWAIPVVNFGSRHQLFERC